MDVLLIDLSSIQDQAELFSSIRLEMARNNIQEGHEFSLRITDFSRNKALSWHKLLKSSFHLGNILK